MMWARRLIAGSGMAIAVVLVAPHAAGAATPCTTPGSMTVPAAHAALPATGHTAVAPQSCAKTPTILSTPNKVVPTIAATHTVPTPVSATSSTPAATSASPGGLPFTGADIGEIAAVGLAAVMAGLLLMRRRHRMLA
jgi:hypothetical protein